MVKTVRPGVEHYADPTSDALLAIVVRADFRGERYNFLTPDDLALQLGINSYTASARIKAHVHIDQLRRITSTLEFILVRRGRVRLQLYDQERRPVAHTELGTGDAVLLVSGGHGFDALEEADLLEVKQGPFVAGADKITIE